MQLLREFLGNRPFLSTLSRFLPSCKATLDGVAAAIMIVLLVVLFSACRPTEVAYETGGHGDFTVAASLLVVPSANRLTNAEFLAKIREAFSSQPRQNPAFNGPRSAKSRIFLGPLVASPVTSPVASTTAVPAGAPTAAPAASPVADTAAGRIDAFAASAGPALAEGSRAADAAARALAAAAFLRAAADFIDG